MPNRKYSKILHDGPQQAASRSMLRGAGFTDEDFEKSIAFKTACDLVFLGKNQPSGYTEPLLHKMRLEKKTSQ